MESTVAESWRVIRDWLAEHCPEELTTSRGPAPERDLRALENAIGRGVPADQRAWWELFDGDDDNIALVPRLWTPLSANDARLRYRMWVQLAPEEPELAEPAGRARWLPEWLPIGATTGGDDLFLDLRSGPLHGCVRERMKGERAGDPVWPGVGAMLSEVAAAMTDGSAVRGLCALDDEGRLEWV